MDSIITFPLYHETSSLFKSSIKENGLGAINPVDELRVIDCLSLLYDIAKSGRINDDEWELQKIVGNHMIKQGVASEEGMNFQHGNTYCSPSKRTAINYANNNPYGSEILSHCVAAYKKLVSICPSELDVIAIDFSEISSLAKKIYKPILIEVTKVPFSAVLTEQGKSPIINIKRIIKYIDTKDENDIDYQILFQQTNFRLISTIPVKNIKFKKVVSSSLL